MQTKTFTLLVTVRDDGIAAVFNPMILAAAVQGALENGIHSFMLDSAQAEALQAEGNPGVKAGEHNLPPVSSASVDAFAGDATHLMCVAMPEQGRLRATRRLHAELRKD